MLLAVIPSVLQSHCILIEGAFCRGTNRLKHLSEGIRQLGRTFYGLTFNFTTYHTGVCVRAYVCVCQSVRMWVWSGWGADNDVN